MEFSLVAVISASLVSLPYSAVLGSPKSLPRLWPFWHKGFLRVFPRARSENSGSPIHTPCRKLCFQSDYFILTVLFVTVCFICFHFFVYITLWYQSSITGYNSKSSDQAHILRRILLPQVYTINLYPHSKIPFRYF